MIMNHRHDRRIELSTSSMADIAFLLLTFFLVTTQLQDQRGLSLILPEINASATKKVQDRNMLAIQLNAADQLMVEGEVRSVNGLREQVRSFVLNHGQDPDLSVSPEDAVVSLRADRQTSHRAFIAVLDEIQAAYFGIYASRVGITPPEFRSLNPTHPRDRLLYDKARLGIPMNVSIAEPTGINSNGGNQNLPYFR
jgi:biopolymer transport protein ExbD